MRAKVYGRFGSNRLEGEGRLYTQEQMNADPTIMAGIIAKMKADIEGLRPGRPPRG
jgi:hypothetical protein